MNQLNRILNIIKTFITSIMGVIIYVITTIFLWRGDIGFLWEGIAGFTIGSILLLFPKAIEKFILTYLGNSSNKSIQVDNKRRKPVDADDVISADDVDDLTRDPDTR